MNKSHDYQPKLVIFTDLDGTLLDHVTYSYVKALPSIEYLQRKGTPIVFCSSKTRAEQKVYRQKLGIHHPFIVENGSAIFISRGYFPFSFDYRRDEDGYQIIELGIPYREIRRILEQIKAEAKVNFKGFGDMSTEEVAADTGLDVEAAQLAKEREYTETVNLKGSPEEIDRVLKAIKQAGINYACGGRYYTVMGPNDKGKAARILIDLFRKKYSQVETVGIGNSLNDLPMLAVVDVPVLLQNPGGVWEEMNIPHLYRAEGAGPEGWSRAIAEIIDSRIDKDHYPH